MSHGKKCPVLVFWYVPLALPGALGDVVERRVEAVDVVGDVALVAQDEARLVVRLAAALAHRAVQAPPPLVQDHLVDLQRCVKYH